MSLNGSLLNNDHNYHTQLLNEILEKLSNLQQQSSQQQHINTPDTQTIQSSTHNHQHEPILSNHQTIVNLQNEYQAKTSKFIESFLNDKFDSFTQIVTTSMIDYNKIENIFKQNKCGNKIFNNKNISKVNNPLDWSFSQTNQSHNASINEFRPDLFQLWHSFESNTWAALDNISQQIKSNSNKLNEINEQLTDNDSTLRNILINKNISRSALTETIQLENSNSNLIDGVHRDTKQCFSSISDTQMESEVINIMANNDADLSQINSTPSNADHMSKLKRELYVSKFNTNITSSHIEQYMSNRGVSIDSCTRITPLIKSNRDRNTLSFISFKIDTTEDIANIITSGNFWPSGCIIKDFKHKQSKCPTIIDENFLIPRSGMTTT